MRVTDVAVVIPVKNESLSLPTLLDALAAQTVQPRELIFVDADSGDATIAVIHDYDDLSMRDVLAAPKYARIGASRNHGARSSQSSIVATTDAGAHPDHKWLERLVGPIVSGQADFTYGSVYPWGASPLEGFLAGLLTPLPGRHPPGAGVNTAYRRDVWLRAEGYPEEPITGEDLAFFERVRKQRVRVYYASNAVVHWHGPGGVRSHLAQYERYARGDATNRLNSRAHLLRTATYGLALFAPWRSILAIPALLQLAVRTANRISRLEFHSARSRVSYPRWYLLSVPPLVAMGDAAKIVGYLRGLWLRRR